MSGIRKFAILVLCIVSFTTTVFAQKRTKGLKMRQPTKLHPILGVKPAKKPKSFIDFLLHTPTIFEIGWNIIDDDGKPFKSLLDIKNSWNVRPYPTRIGIAKQVAPYWYVEASFSYTVYKTGKTINHDVIGNSGNFYSIDLETKYDLNQLIGNTLWFDPYISAGFAYTNRVISIYPSTFTGNFGVGANFWIFDESIGIMYQTQGKLGIHTPFIRNETNYLQHNIGIIFKTDAFGKEYMKSRYHIKTITRKYNKLRKEKKAKF